MDKNEYIFLKLKGGNIMGIDAIITLAGLAIPPVVDFVKKKFLKPSQDTPEATISALATTKPDVLPAYLSAQTSYMEATIKFFNRDVCGSPSQWVVDLRAAIRPSGVVISFAILFTLGIMSVIGYQTDATMADTLAGVRYSCELVVSSWFGDRISISK